MIPARRLHEMRTMALWPEQTFSQVMGPICLTFLMILRSLLSIFQGSDINQIYYLGIEGEKSTNAELDDEHVGNALASPLFTKESEAEASLAQTYHSNEENLLRGAQLWQTLGNPSFGRQNGRRAESWNMEESRQFCKYNRSNFLQKRDPRSGSTRTKEILPRKGQIESQDIGSQAYSRRVCTIETRTGSSSRRGSRSRTSSSREPHLRNS